MRFETREQYEAYKAAERHRAFLEAIQPFIRHKCYIANICMPQITIYPDRTERVYPQWAQDAFAQLDAVIEQVRRSFDIK